MTDTNVVIIFSGGLDSTTLVYDALDHGENVKKLVSFNYGQRHKKELEYASLTAQVLELPHVIIDLWSSGLTEALSVSGSSLISNVDVPEGHYAEENMKATVVPNRNMIMLSIAGGIAVAEGAERVLTGVHAGDHAIYPDCRPAFIRSAAQTLYYGNEGFGNFNPYNSILAPYLMKTKAEIARRAFELGVPLEQTWSCYKGGDLHCGRCGTCVERLEAIAEAQSYIKFNDSPHKLCIDHTEYADTEFWKTAEVPC